MALELHQIIGRLGHEAHLKLESKQVMKIQNAYDIWSRTYDTDRNLTRDLDAKVTRERLRQQRFQTILEMGCGTGKNTAFFSEIATHVQATDFSLGMLEKAKTKVSADNVTFAVADLTQKWPCRDQTADLVTCNLVLEHIADLNFIFAEAARTLVEDGRFFVCELHPFKQYQGAKANFASGQETTEIEAFVHHISEFLNAADASGLKLVEFKEWWHAQDEGKPPRLISFIFKGSNKSSTSG